MYVIEDGSFTILWMDIPVIKKAARTTTTPMESTMGDCFLYLRSKS
jgi:hypothetical protein